MSQDRSTLIKDWRLEMSQDRPTLIKVLEELIKLIGIEDTIYFIEDAIHDEKLRRQWGE